MPSKYLFRVQYKIFKLYKANITSTYISAISKYRTNCGPGRPQFENETSTKYMKTSEQTQKAQTRFA